MAVNSGLAAYPASYTRIWSGAGGAIWRPVAPPGYVAAGDLFTADDQEPELSDMVCMHGEILPAHWQCRIAVVQIHPLSWSRQLLPRLQIG